MPKGTPQYENFIELVTVPNSLEEEKRVKNYWLIVNTLKTVTVIALILFIISIELDLALKGIIEVVAVICLVIYIYGIERNLQKDFAIFFLKNAIRTELWQCIRILFPMPKDKETGSYISIIWQIFCIMLEGVMMSKKYRLY